jgi:hypothetical protein
MFAERLSNRLLAACIRLRSGARLIAINARFSVDPEVLTHTLIEKYIHAQQMENGVDFVGQRHRYSYAERPYEIQAKALGDELLGFAPDAFDTLLLRDEPATLLYDTRPP